MRTLVKTPPKPTHEKDEENIQEAICPFLLGVEKGTGWALAGAYPHDKQKAVILQIARVGIALDVEFEGQHFYWMDASTARFLADSLRAAADAISKETTSAPPDRPSPAQQEADRPSSAPRKGKMS